MPISSPVQIVGSFSWSPSEAKQLEDTHTNLYQYDAGVEYALIRIEGTKRLGPFIGAGLGGRTYSVTSSSSSQTGLDGYGSIGGRFTASKLGARVELRDYLSKFKGLEGGRESSTRNDLMLAGLVTFRI